jgi:poly(3-hydroxybutyrate) depolymerase
MMASYNIDRKRVYLTGWTGGASFMARYGAERADRFAALSFVSGGARPQSACPGCKIPVQVMVGTNDTSTAGVRATRDYFRQCGHTVDYRQVRGRRGDLSGFLRRGGSLLIVDWLLKHYNRCGHW